MARTVKTAEVRQDELLDVAQRLFMTRGYTDTPVQAIIDEVGIAKGTFYHHYPSKSHLLDALVRRMIDQSMGSLRTIADDPSSRAIDKLNRLYGSALAWKTDRRELLVDLRRALDSESNTLLMKRIERDSAERFVPILAALIRQGVAEGDFDARHPVHAARVVHEIGQHLLVSLRDAMIGGRAVPPTWAEVREEVEAFHDAVERVLGARRGTVLLVDLAALEPWLKDLSERSAP